MASLCLSLRGTNTSEKDSNSQILRSRGQSFDFHDGSLLSGFFGSTLMFVLPCHAGIVGKNAFQVTKKCQEKDEISPKVNLAMSRFLTHGRSRLRETPRIENDLQEKCRKGAKFAARWHFRLYSPR